MKTSRQVYNFTLTFSLVGLLGLKWSNNMDKLDRVGNGEILD